MRKPIVAANWKMNGNSQLVADFAQTQLQSNVAEIIYGLPAILISQAKSLGLKNIAGEDVSANKNGAFTGEISAVMLKEQGAEFCIIGHSERRQYHGENEKLLAEKWARLNEENIAVIYCIGETEAEYDAGITKSVLERQLNPMLAAGLIDENTVIAYEPVWAIGTGKAATAEYAEKTHQEIREIISRQSADVASKIRILYGGSVKANNAEELANMENIDGFLVGGASLKINEFKQIIEAFK